MPPLMFIATPFSIEFCSRETKQPPFLMVSQIRFAAYSTTLMTSFFKKISFSTISLQCKIACTQGNAVVFITERELHYFWQKMGRLKSSMTAQS